MTTFSEDNFFECLRRNYYERWSQIKYLFFNQGNPSQMFSGREWDMMCSHDKDMEKNVHGHGVDV